MNQESQNSDLQDERLSDPATANDSSGGNSRRTMFLGLLLCVLSALGYSTVNACLRQLTIDCDRVLVIFIKELVAVVVVGPWLAWHALHGRRLLPGGGVLLALAIAGLMTQLCGNLPNLWVFSVIGLAVAVPLMSGTNLVATAILGRIFLGERVSRKTAISIGLLVCAVFLLLVAAMQASQSIQPEDTSAAVSATVEQPDTSGKTNVAWTMALLASATTCFVGIVYAGLVVVIRRNVTSTTPAVAVVFIVTGMGVVSLGPWLVRDRGPEVLLDLPMFDLGLMLLAGVLNVLSFLAITRGLQWTPAARANMILTTQVVLGAVMGVSIFGERSSVWLLLGVCATIAGMILIGQEVRTEPETPETPV